MTLKDIEVQIQQTKRHVEKGLGHLEYSLDKVTKFPDDYNIEDYEILETLESFTSRFSRLSDIVSKKLVRSLVLKDDPSFSGGLMDFLNRGEKLGFISDANQWWVILSLRNKEAHEYTEEDLRAYFHTVAQESTFVISETRSLLNKL